MPTSSTDIQRACESLVLRFAQIVDSGRFDELAQVFAADALFYRPAEPDRALSVQAVIESYRRLLSPNVSAHLVTNVIVTPESHCSATGSSMVCFFGASRDAPNETGRGRKTLMQGIGRFSDRFALTSEGWRFTERRGEGLFNF